MSFKFNYMKAAGTRGTFSDAGNWNELGKPKYLEPSRVHLTDTTIDRIIRSVPEKRPVPIYNPSYISDTTQRNILITKDNTQIVISFIHEGAGYRNAMGFYTYTWSEKHKVPTDVEEIASNYTIVFPNASYVNSGGDMVRGDRVDIGTFAANTAIGFFVIPDGWDAKSTTGIKTTHNSIVHSDSHLNSNKEVQTVLLQDEQNNGVFIGFEDILRPGGDQDFNDLIIYLEVVPEDPKNLIEDVIEGVYQIPQLLPSHAQVYTGLFADESGLYFSIQSLEEQVLKSRWLDGVSDVAEYLLEHEIDLEDDTKDAAFMKGLWDSIQSTTFRSGESKVRSEPSAVTGKPSLRVTYRIPTDKLRTFNYLVRSKDNLDSKTVRGNGKTDLENLVDLERQYVGLGRSERWSIERTDDDKTRLEQPNSSVRSTLSEENPVIWGDPHVRLASGQTLTLPNKVCSFLLYQDVVWSIVAQMGPDPRASDDPNMRDACFIQSLTIQPVRVDTSVTVDAMNNTIAKLPSSTATGGNTMRVYPDHSVRRFHNVIFEQSNASIQEIEGVCPLWVKSSREYCRRVYGQNANVMCFELYYRYTGLPEDTVEQDPNSFKLRIVNIPDRYGHWNQIEICSPLSSWTNPSGVLVGKVAFEQLIVAE